MNSCRDVREAQRGYMLMELCLTLAVSIPILLGISSLVHRHLVSTAVQERRADDEQARARAMRCLSHALRNARTVTASGGVLRVTTSDGSTRWHVEDSTLHYVGEYRGRLRGIDAIELERDGRLVHVTLHETASRRWTVTVMPRGGAE